MPRKLKILLVDEARYRRLLSVELKQAYGHEIEEAGGYEEAVQLFEQNPALFDLAIVDYSLEGERSGVELLRRLHETDPNLPVIIITGVGDRKISQEALRAGAFWYLDKPHDWVELEMLLKWVGRYRAASRLVNPQLVWGANLWMPVSDAIVSAQTIPDLVDAVRSKALSLLEAERCGILEVDPEEGSIRGWSAADGEEQDFLAQLFSSLASDMERLETPILTSVTEIGTNVPHYRAWAACACPPVRGATEILFALFEKEPTEEQKLGLVLKLVTLARLIGVALENLRKAKLLEALVDAGRQLLTVRDRNHAFQILIEQLLCKLEVRTFYIAIHRRSNNTIHFPLFYYQGEEIALAPTLDLKRVDENQSFTAYVLHRNEELTIEDMNDPPYPTRPYPIQGIRTKAYFAVPLHRPDGSAFGVLSIQSTTPRHFSKPLKQTVRGLADLIAPTLNRLRRSRLQERLLEELMAGEPQAFLKESLHSIWEAVNADLVTFYPYDSKRRIFRLDQIQSSPKSSVIPTDPENEIPVLERILILGEHFAKDLDSDEIFGSNWATRHGTKSLAGLAVKPIASSPPLGIVIVHYREQRDLNQDLRGDILRFSQFTAVAANLIKQQDQQKRSEGERQLLERLNEEVDRHQLAWIIEEMVPAILPGILECQFLLTERGERQLYSPLRYGSQRILFGEGLIGQVAQSGESILAQDPQSLMTSKPNSPKARSALGVPVKLGDVVLGVVSLESPDEGVFEEEDRQFLESIGKSVATALISASRKEAASLFTDVARRVLLDPERGLEIITESAHDIVARVGGHPTSTTVFLFTGKHLELVEAWPPTEKRELWNSVGILPLEASPGRSLGVVARAALERRTRYVSNVAEEPNYIAFDRTTRAELAVPVLAADQSVVGVLNLEYANAEALSAQDITLIELLADQAAFIESLRHQLQIKKEERARTIEAAVAMIGLEAAFRRHGWEQSIPAVKNYTYLIRQAINRLVSDKGLLNIPSMFHNRKGNNHAVVSIVDSVESIDAILDNVGPAGRDAAAQEKTAINVHKWLTEVQARWKALRGETLFSLAIHVDSHESIFGNFYLLAKALDNLIHNAVTAANKTASGKPSVAIECRMTEASILRIEVMDNGPGIPDQIRPFLFNSPIPRELIREGGHGIGGLLTGFIAQTYGGSCFIGHPDSEQWTTRVVMELPVLPKTPYSHNVQY